MVIRERLCVTVLVTTRACLSCQGPSRRQGTLKLGRDFKRDYFQKCGLKKGTRDGAALQGWQQWGAFTVRREGTGLRV